MAGPEKCAQGMVYVPEATYNGKSEPALCVDEHEFTNGDYKQLAQSSFQRLPALQLPKELNDPQQPMVRVDGYDAKQLCEMQGKRLATHWEWARIASQNGTKEYSTHSGKLDSGVHYNANATRKACAATGHYVEYGGKKVCDMNGNVGEWTFDPTNNQFYISGGSWSETKAAGLSAYFRYTSSLSYRLVDVGFRCVASPQKPRKVK